LLLQNLQMVIFYLNCNNSCLSSLAFNSLWLKPIMFGSFSQD
jgi:hypothetical protein